MKILQGVLGCATDVAPTILGLIGRPYETLFFGTDLLNCAESGSRVLLNHNRHVVLLAGDRLVVLGLKQTEEFYAGDPKRVEMRRVAQPAEGERQLAQHAIAIYQVTGDIYTSRRYRIDAEQ